MSRIDVLLKETDRRLRRQNGVLVELARRPSIHSGKLAEAMRDIVEAAAETVEVERIGIWFLTPDRQAIRCVELFERTPRVHSGGGGELTALRFPIYFKALETERTIRADDATLDPRTSAFAESYLNRHGVTSMLDAPIRRMGQVFGVVCFEHVGPQRSWTAEEENFASSVADLVTMALDAAERREQQEAMQHRLDYERLIGAISTRFANAGDEELDAAIVDALADIARFVGVPRAHVFLVLEDGLSARLAYEWNAAGSVARRELYGELPTASFPWWSDRLREGDVLRWRTTEELPAEAANERRLAERYGIVSAIFTPLRVSKELAGSVGLSTVTEETEWSEETIRLLRISAEIIGSALERIRTFRALRNSEERYRLMAEYSTDLIARTTRDGIFVYASDAARTLLDYEPSELIGRHVLDFVHPDDHHIVKRFIALLELRRSSHTFSFRARRKDGSAVWFESTSRAIVDPETKSIEEIVSVSRDISERRRAEEQIEYQAYHDSLTGLPNRLLFRDRLTIALAHAKRQNATLAVMFLDLDRFKFVNDTLGHSLGDELLREVAFRLRAVLREGDTIARMGGDEFTVLLTDIRDANAAAKIAGKLLDTVSEVVRIEGHELYITTSIGIALHPSDGDTAEGLLKNADAAMYRAKENGRNAFRLFSPAMNTRAAERLSIEGALRRALEREELILQFQPIVRLDSRVVTGREALLRWNRPGHGLVPPASFIDIAEETRLIVPIGAWVLHEACRRATLWHGNGHPVRVSVNLSPRQFQQADLRDVVQGALDASGLSAEALELEITESTAMLNTARTMATLAGLRDLGVRIALDDFGTGHSSLNYLRRYPIDRVKIDREFIQEIEESHSDRAIVSAIVTMAHGLSLAVTAEGVETEGQAAFLREQECEEVQGFLFGRPEGD